MTSIFNYNDSLRSHQLRRPVSLIYHLRMTISRS